MANTTRGRVIRELFLVAIIAAFIVPWSAATANVTAQLATDTYGWEPLNVIAGSSELRLHSMGEDIWEVWVCDTSSGNVTVTPAGATAVLNAEIAPFYRWLSGDAYRPVFRAGGTVTEASSCALSVAGQVTSAPNGVIIVTDEASNGGSAQSGIWCPYEGLCPASPATYPDNYRTVTLGAHAVVGSNPRLVTAIHELGHTIHFGHSFSGAISGTWAEYDNPTDVMSKAGDRTRTMGTLALNRYIAGWIDESQATVVQAPGTYAVSALGGDGLQLLFIPNGEQGWYTVIDARVRTGYDESLPSGGVTVHTLDQRPEACGSSMPCFGLSRRVSQSPAESDSHDHVLAVGDQQVLANGWILSVEQQLGDRFVVSVSDTSAPSFPGPVTVGGIEASSVALSWPAAQDEGPVTYDVLVNGQEIMETSATSAVVTGLAPGQTHEIGVRARDNSGHEAWAPPVVVETLARRDQWVAHNPKTGLWSFRLGEGVVRSVYYGVPGDVPMLCDWDGDGIDTVGLYRPTEGYVYLRNTNTLGFADTEFFYGIPSDLPVCGDWDGDGVDTVGIYRTADHSFYLRNANTLGFADVVVVWGEDDDHPIVGDWDGDGVDTVAVVRSGMAHAPDGSQWPVDGVGRMAVGDLSGTGRDVVARHQAGVITVVGAAGSQQLVRFGDDPATVLAGWWD